LYGYNDGTVSNISSKARKAAVEIAPKRVKLLCARQIGKSFIGAAGKLS
jgi:hypothetical protein